MVRFFLLFCFFLSIYVEAYDCKSKIGTESFAEGARNSRNLVIQNWRSIFKNCSLVSDLSGALTESPLAVPSKTDSEYSICFYRGYTQTLLSELAKVYSSCGYSCYLDGKGIGVIMGKATCRLVKRLGNVFQEKDIDFVYPQMKICGAQVKESCSLAIDTQMGNSEVCMGYIENNNYQEFRDRECSEVATVRE